MTMLQDVSKNKLDNSPGSVHSPVGSSMSQVSIWPMLLTALFCIASGELGTLCEVRVQAFSGPGHWSLIVRSTHKLVDDQWNMVSPKFRRVHGYLFYTMFQVVLPVMSIHHQKASSGMIWTMVLVVSIYKLLAEQ